MDEFNETKGQMLLDLAKAFDIPVELLLMTDAEFHHWLHTTEHGQRLLAT